MKLIIAGSRHGRLSLDQLLDLSDLKNDMDRIGSPITEVVSGGASGIDSDGELWARLRDIPVKVFKADWGTHGRAAGPIRNRQMAEYADAVVLFPGGRGTDSMFEEADAAGLRIFDWRRS